jgi:NitT/TauT family transport system ATP-binding protein
LPFETPALPPLVTLEGVGKVFRNGVVALDGIDLAIASGSFVSLLGPSGCGKSTLLRIISGLVEPSQGKRR